MTTLPKYGGSRHYNKKDIIKHPDLTQDEQDYVIQALKEGKQSILRFADYFLPHYKRDKQGNVVSPATIHDEFDSILRGSVTNWDGLGKYNVLGILPRGCAKSTIGGLWFALWNAVYTDKEYIGIVGASEESVSDHINNIRTEIKTNELLHLVGVYPDPDGLDNAQHFDFIAPNYPGAVYKDDIRRVRLSAYSTSSFPRGKSPGGRRFDLIIIDDLEQTKKGNKTGVENPKYRDEIRSLFDAEIVPSGFNDDELQIVMLGTIMHEAQLLYKIYKDSLIGMQDPEFRCIKYAMIENYGTPDAYSIWPEKMSLEKFEKKMAAARYKGKEHLVYNEYLSEPMSPETQIFHKKDLKYFVDRAGAFIECDSTGRLVEEGLKTTKSNTSNVVAVDFAFTVEKTSDNTSFAVCACDNEENIYILDIIADKWKAYEVAQQARKILDKYNPVSFGAESNSGGRPIIEIIERELKNNKAFKQCGITPIKSNGLSKQDRIIAKLQFPYNNGKIFHRYGADYLEAYEHELISVTTRGIVCAHDDRVDSVSMIYDIVEEGATYSGYDDEEDYDDDEEYNCTLM